MDSSIKKLFELIQESLNDKVDDKGIIDKIKADETLIKASNSYCVQCGNCCKSDCKNKEKIEGLVYCLLHDDSKKQIRASYEDIPKRLDSKKWSKPLVCHTYGPHLVLLSMIHYTEQKNFRMALDKKNDCPGAAKMFDDYKEFISQ